MGGSRWGQQAQQRQALQPYPDYVPGQPGYLQPYVPASGPPGRLRKPAGSRVLVKQHGPRLEIDIPPAGMSGACRTQRAAHSVRCSELAEAD